MTNSLSFDPVPDDQLIFLPLGGAGEIGMNLNLYGCKGRWIIVDLGVSFGDESVPAIDVVMPDPAFIVERREALAGIVLTHAHEDHLGAVAYLWPFLRCPVYATPFAAALLRGKLMEAGLEKEVPVTIIPLGGHFTIGPFEIELVTLTHSIPEPNGLAIHTPYGTVLHTGDWKFDPDPLIGDKSDTDFLRRLGDSGVLALIGDSTNVFNQGHSGSEAEVRDSLIELFGQYDGKIAVACFASNVARLESVTVAAHKHGRHVCLVGRSLWRVVEAAKQNGYLLDLPPFLTEHDAAFLDPDKVVYLCTGSQGEPRAALSRIANRANPQIVLGEGDVCVFSSRIIPGNEKSIFELQNRLAKMGVEIVTEKDHFIHVSGHPAREELIEMYQLVRPQIAVPVHGEYRHLTEHAELALSCQVPEALVVENGSVVRLAPGPAAIVDHVRTGRLAVDGERLLPLDSDLLRTRKRMVFNGTVVVTLVIDRLGQILGDPQISALGLLCADEDAEEYDMIVESLCEAIMELPLKVRQDDSIVKETARQIVRRHFKALCGKKPVTDVHLVRV